MSLIDSIALKQALAVSAILEDKKTIEQIIDEHPSAQPERKKGKWIKEYWNGEHTRKCSACNITQTVTTYRGKVNFNYCPYCGADMRGDKCT